MIHLDNQAFFRHVHPPPSPPKQKKPPTSPTVGENEKLWQEFASPIPLTAHMFAPKSPLLGLLQLSTRLGVQVKPRKRHTRTSQQMMCFNAGSKSNPDPQPVHLTLIRVEAWIYYINTHADVYLLSYSGRLSWTDCVSLALTHRCWHIDRWVSSCPLGLLLMVSARMDGLNLKVQLVIS